MQTFKLLFAFACAGLAIYIGWTVFTQYAAATGTVWARLLAAARCSATQLWNKFGMLLAGLVGSIGQLGDLLGQPQIRGYAEAALGNPQVVAGIMLAITAVSYAARNRTL